jgi:tetraacyldisaccharide 4'-kinase
VEEPPTGVGRSLVRAGLAAATVPYLLGLKANLAIYDLGLKARSGPALPVVSVGNLSLGGTGKSTTVAYLARQLQERGLHPGVVTRGYGRRMRQQVLLVSAGQGLLIDSAEAGDEPAMLAALLPGVPIAVGTRRERAIGLLRERTRAQVVLLDDGFQYFRMERLVNLVLLDAGRVGVGERLFPAGYLREPWSHLRRADQVWLTHTDEATPDALERLQAAARRYCPAYPPVLTRHRLIALRGPAGERRPPEELAGLRVLAVSGLGNPASFERSLQQAGAEVVPCRYPDHHRYGAADLRRLVAEQRRQGAALVVTTQKDAVKLPPDSPLPLWVAQCELEVLHGEEQVQALLNKVRGVVI